MANLSQRSLAQPACPVPGHDRRADGHAVGSGRAGNGLQRAGARRIRRWPGLPGPARPQPGEGVLSGGAVVIATDRSALLAGTGDVIRQVSLLDLGREAPIPVRMTVDLPRRPSAMIEAVAYFVVSEGLTNITKHAQASQAEVVVQWAGDRLHIIVSDDGVGGADPARGTGLAGLAKRAASVDGTFDIASPPGGPTLLTVDLPCAQ